MCVFCASVVEKASRTSTACLVPQNCLRCQVDNMEKRAVITTILSFSGPRVLPLKYQVKPEYYAVFQFWLAIEVKLYIFQKI